MLAQRIFRPSRIESLGYLSLLLASCLFLLAPPRVAATEPHAKDVYVVDMQKVIEESIAGKAAKSNMNQEVGKSEAKLGKLKNELSKISEDLDRQSGLLSEQALQDKRDLIDRKQKELGRAVSDNREELAKKSDTEISKIVKQIDQVVKDLSAKGKYEIVIERDPRFVLYVDDKFDLTKRVIEELDRRSENMEG